MLLKVEILWQFYLYYTIWSFECTFKPNKSNKPFINTEIKNSQFAEILNVPETCQRKVLGFSHVCPWVYPSILRVTWVYLMVKGVSWKSTAVFLRVTRVYWRVSGVYQRFPGTSSVNLCWWTRFLRRGFERKFILTNESPELRKYGNMGNKFPEPMSAFRNQGIRHGRNIQDEGISFIFEYI